MAFLADIMRRIGRLWLTGGLYLFAVLGFVFYGLLWTVRLMQTSRKLIAAVATLALLCVAIVFVLLSTRAPSGEDVEIVVVPGQTLRSVAERLHESRVIGSPNALVVWMKAVGIDKKVQAGRHVFEVGEGVWSASRKLQCAIPLELEGTVPEGLIVEQVASVVSDAFGVDSAEFVALCYDSEFAGEEGIEARTLEGYLFPDTYRFAPEVLSRTVIAKMVDRFEEQFRRLAVDTAAEHHLTRHEFVTLASIVEKEATLDEERRRIAGVFHNRLKLGYPLGADPTVRYALRKFHGPLRVSELSRPHPYNTRVHRGLPPGPICSPGFASLQAAVGPIQTKDLYFVAKWDGTGAHDFSRTHQEHERKKLEIRRQNELRNRMAKKG